MNFLSNSIKFTGENGKIKVSLDIIEEKNLQSSLINDVNVINENDS